MRDIVSYVARSRYAILESLPLAFSLEKNLARCPDFAALIICCSWNKIRSSHNSIYFIFYLLGAFGKFHGKTFVFSKVESDPPIRLSKSWIFHENSLGFDLPNGFKKLGGPKLGQRTILKNGGTNSRTTDTPPNYRLIADPETWIAR